MSISSEIIGKLGGGGADVDSFPVNITASGDVGSAEVLATIQIPPGETWLVAVVGNMSNASTNDSNWALLSVGSTQLAVNGSTGIAAVVGSTTEVKITRRRKYGADSFSGDIYTTKL